MFWELLRQRGAGLGGCPPQSAPLGWSAEEPPPRHGSSCPSLPALREGLQRAPPASPGVSFLVGILSRMAAGAARSLGTAGAFPPLSLAALPCSPRPGEGQRGGRGTQAVGAERGGGLPGPVPEKRAGCPFCSQCTGWPRCGQLRLATSPMRAMQEEAPGHPWSGAVLPSRQGQLAAWGGAVTRGTS